MSLRLRLIVAFVALSVVPLGAMTWFTYTNSAQALRDAAAHESDMLASELSGRMQNVTAQLSERVGHLMDMEAEAVPVRSTGVVPATSAAPAVAAASSPTPPSPPSAAPPASPPRIVAVATPEFEAEIAERLGDAAMMLNNVELRGLAPATGRRGGPRPEPGPQQNGRDSGRSGAAGPNALGSNSASTADSSSRSANASPPPRTSRGNRGTSNGGSRDGNPRATAEDFRSRLGRSGDSSSAAPAATDSTSAGNDTSRAASSPNPPAPPDQSATPSAAAGPVAPSPGVPRVPPPGRPGEPAPPRSAAVPGPNDRIRIELGSIRRELFREISPEKSLSELGPDERRRVLAELNQRILGIQQGLKLGAAELQKQADEAKRDAQGGDAPVAPPPPAAPPKPAAAPPKPPAAPTTAKPALSGNRLSVQRERNGVVSQVNAEVDLPYLLSTVFAATPRDRGEVPFAIDKDGHIYAPTAEDRKIVEGLGNEVSRPDGSVGTTQLPEWIVRTTADPSGSGLTFGIARPVGEALKDIRATAIRSAGLGLAFIALTLIGIVPLSASLTKNLSSLNVGVHQIASGDYRARVPVKTKDEFGQLARAFNQMAEDVERHQQSAVGQERIRRELELGREIQHTMLPHAPLQVGPVRVQGVSSAAGEVGGDFFNYFELRDGRVALLVGDVSGKGVGAALLMANIQASLRTRLALGQDLEALAEELDRDIQANTPGAVYATLFVGSLDPATRVLRYLNAGHNPQYVLRPGGQLERLESSGLPVGLIAGRGYREGQVQLAPGDVVFCYTDGCVEAENEQGEMFGAEALERELLAAGPLPPADLLRRMEEVLRAFVGRREPFDDATMMVARVE